MRNYALSICLTIGAVLGQAPTGPVVQPRGIVNAFAQHPAPSTVAPGGLLVINGINLAPPEGIKPDSLPLPTKIGDPAIEVLINNRPAPIVSAIPSQITVQVPIETAIGLASVIVKRGDQLSRVARVTIQALAPSVLAANELGYGPVWNTGTNTVLRLRASSIGSAEPRVANGEVATEALPSRANIYVYAAGLLAVSTTTYSTTKPGEFDIEVTLPEGTNAGDAILLVANNAEANLVTNRRGPIASESIYIPFPSGTPDLRSLRSSNLRGLFLNANAARGNDSCYTSFTIDASKKSVRKVDGCLTTSQAQAPTPFVESLNAATFAAFEGPFTGTVLPGQATPVSNKVRVFHPSVDTPVTALLPAAATNINSTEGGDFIAVVPGAAGTAAKGYRIDSLTGAVEEVVQGGGGGLGGGNAQNLLLRFQSLDLGDGVDKLMSMVYIVNNQFILTASNNQENPTRAKVALINAQGDIVSKRDFPAGWLPIAAPAPPAQVLPPGVVLPPGGLFQLRAPTPVHFDQQSRSYYVASRDAEGRHGFVYFPTDSDPTPIPLPENWYFTSCIANMPVFMIDLARSISMLASKIEDRTFKNTCAADGFLMFDLATRQFTAVSLPGSGKVNASAGATEMNDFLLGSNSDTLFALDGVNNSVFRFDLPPGVNNFTGSAPIPLMNLVIAQANNRPAVNGDAGLVLFDLERTESRLLSTPEGFATINYIGLLPTQRKLVARGLKAGNTGSQILIYNLDTRDLEIIPNPDGVAWAGSPPLQNVPGVPQQQAINIPIRVNQKASTIEAITYAADRKQLGAMVVRVY